MNQATSYLNALRAFEAAARHESLSSAATELNVSHSVVSKHVRNLEEWLHTPLFIRHGNRVELTDSARIFASRISEGFQIISEACGNYRGTYGVMTLNIKAEPAFARRWLRRQLKDFQSRQPQIDVSLQTDASVPNLNDGSTDIAVHFESLLVNEGASQDRLFPIDGYPTCSPTFLKQHANSINKQDILQLPLVHDHGRTVWRQWFNKYFPHSDAWEKGNVYSDLLLALDYAVDGEGMFLADSIIFAKEMDSGALVKLDDRVLRCTWYSAAYSTKQPINPAVSIFRSWLLEASEQHRNTTTL